MKPQKQRKKKHYKILTKTNPTDDRWRLHRAYLTPRQMRQAFTDLMASRSNAFDDAPGYEQYQMFYPTVEETAAACQSTAHPKTACHGGIWRCPLCLKNFCEAEEVHAVSGTAWFFCGGCAQSARAFGSRFRELVPRVVGIKGGPDPNPALTRAIIAWQVEDEEKSVGIL